MVHIKCISIRKTVLQELKLSLIIGEQIVIESTCNAGDLDLIPWVGKIPLRRERLPTPVFWPGEFHGLYSPWGHKQSDTTCDFHFAWNKPKQTKNMVKQWKISMYRWYMKTAHKWVTFLATVLPCLHGWLRVMAENNSVTLPFLSGNKIIQERKWSLIMPKCEH